MNGENKRERERERDAASTATQAWNLSLWRRELARAVSTSPGSQNWMSLSWCAPESVVPAPFHTPCILLCPQCAGLGVSPHMCVFPPFRLHVYSLTCYCVVVCISVCIVTVSSFFSCRLSPPCLCVCVCVCVCVRVCVRVEV